MISYSADNHSLWAKKKRKELEKREMILEKHREGTLPRSFYKFCKGNKGKGIPPHLLEEL